MPVDVKCFDKCFLNLPIKQVPGKADSNMVHRPSDPSRRVFVNAVAGAVAGTSVAQNSFAAELGAQQPSGNIDNVMQFHLLGSSAGKPVPRPFCTCHACQVARRKGGKDRRTRTSVNLYLGKEGPGAVRYKVDLSPDTTAHMHRFGMNLTKLEHLLVTHPHIDHFDPFFLSVRSSVLSGVANLPILHVYGGPGVEKALRAKAGDLTKQRITFHRIAPFQQFQAGDLEVFSLHANHHYPSPYLNYVVSAKNVTVLLAWDTGFWREETWRKAANLRFDAVIMECTVISKKGKPLRPGHNDIETFLKMKERMIRMNMIEQRTPVVAMHIGDNGLVSHDEAQNLMDPHHIKVGYDGLLLSVGKKGSNIISAG